MIFFGAWNLRLRGSEMSHLVLRQQLAMGVVRIVLPKACSALRPDTLLGGSGVVISRVISALIWVRSIVTLLISLLITTHEPPSRPCIY